MEDRILVLGAGNGGQAVAAHKALEGFEVVLFELPQFSLNIQPFQDTRKIEIIWDDGNKKIANLHLITSDIERAFENVSIIFVVVPAFGHKRYAELIAPYIKDDHIIVLFPGSGGSLEFAEVFKNQGVFSDVIMCESSTLPYGTRLISPGKVKVFIEALQLPTGVFPSQRSQETINKLQTIYPSIQPAQSVLEAALNNPNPIVHPVATLLSASRIEYSNGNFFLYQEGMTPAIARCFEALETERQLLLDKLGYVKFHHKTQNIARLNLGDSIEECRQKILSTTMDAAFGPNSIDAGIMMKGPSKLDHRYISEDVPYGLVLLSSLGDLLEIPTPICDAVINLCSIINQTNYMVHGRGIKRLGLENLNTFQIKKYLLTGKK